MTRINFENELTNLKHMVIRMAEATQNATELATRALVAKDYDLAAKIIKDDDLIDKMEIEIEDTCIQLIVTQQPMASDMRLIFTINKIAVDLERIADYAHSISKLNIKMRDEVYMKRFVNLEKMSEICVKMIKSSIDAFIKNDVDLAQQIYNMDDELDDLYHEIFTELMSYVIMDPKNIAQAMNLLLIARYYERTGDHTQNICEWVYYNKEGKRLSDPEEVV